MDASARLCRRGEGHRCYVVGASMISSSVETSGLAFLYRSACIIYVGPSRGLIFDGQRIQHVYRHCQELPGYSPHKYDRLDLSTSHDKMQKYRDLRGSENQRAHSATIAPSSNKAKVRPKHPRSTQAPTLRPAFFRNPTTNNLERAEIDLETTAFPRVSQSPSNELDRFIASDP